MNRPPGKLRLESGVAEHLIGVIDLKDGCAVHAVAGKRHQYKPVSLPGVVNRGNPQELIAFYAALGLTRLYIADLDAIEKRSPQWQALHTAMRSPGLNFESLLLDLGWRGDEDHASMTMIANWMTEFPQLCIVAATESAISPDAFRRLSETVQSNRLFMGLDYRGGQLIGANSNEDDSIRLAVELSLAGIVVLDLDSVGTAAGPTTPTIIRRIRKRFPFATIVSGGGIRAAGDVDELLQSGCDHCLVATALHACR